MKLFMLLLTLQSPQDTAHVKAQRIRLDSTVVVMDALERWCRATYTTPKYLRAVCPAAKLRPDRRARVYEDSLLFGPPVPPIPVNQRPHAAFTVSWAGTTATLDASTSTDDKGIVSYEWRAGPRPLKTGPVITRGWSSTDQPFTDTLIVRDAGGLADTTTRQILGPPTTPPPDTTTPPPPPPPSGAVANILALIGPTKTVTETRALGPLFARYDSLFTQYLPTSNTWQDNYYDRGVAYYARYARTGDPKWLTLAHAIVVAYRDQYLVPNDYGTSPHWSQIRGVELHYRLTGDAASKLAVVGVANRLATYSLPLWGNPKVPDLQNTQMDYMENRIQARVLQAALSAYRLGDTATPWPAKIRTMLDQILSTQNASGSYSWIQVCGGQLNYMVGMLNDVLIEYWNTFEQDPRIPSSVERANEFLWSTQWLAADQAFKYASVNCAPNPFGTNVGGTDPSGDLNGLMIASFGWLSQRTGDAKWRTRGDAIMAGLVANRWASQYAYTKQFNQAFAESYRYLGWR